MFRLRGRARRLWSRIATLRGEPWSLLVCVLLGVTLSLPAVGPQRVLDDAILERSIRGPALPGLADGVFGMFRFASGEPTQNRELVERGVLLPWWSDQELRVAFLRPLSGLTHVLDFVLWPNSSELMYLHSLGWLGLVILAASRLYRQLEPGKGAAIGAALLFSVDPTQGAAVSWLSSRNTLIAALFGICAVSAWVASSRWLSLLLLGLALFSGEVGVCAIAYIVCHAFFLDARPARDRVLSVLPVAVVAVAWRIVHVAFGFGARASGAYLDPVHDFSVWLAVLPERLLATVSAELGPVPADVLFVGKSEHLPIFLALALATVLAFGFVIHGRLRDDRVARFWTCGSLLAALPLSAAPPNDRGLLFVALGVKALVARLVIGRCGSNRTKRRRRGIAPAIILGFVAWHVVAAPIARALRSGQFQIFGRGLSDANIALDTIPNLPRRTVVVLNPPLDMLASYVQAERAVRGLPLAGHLYWLASASSMLTITRVASDALEVTREGGLCSTALERLYRRDPRTLRPGTSIDLEAMRVEIVESAADGMPVRARFSFRAPLEDESLVFLAWRAGRYVRVAPPEPGRPSTFQREDLARLLLARAMGPGT